MAKNKNDYVVIAIYGNDNAASEAIEYLKDWDRANKDIKLGAIGTIKKDGDSVKTNTGRNTGKGAKVGAVLFVASAVLTGGATLVASAASGAVAGGAVGTFFKKSVHMTKEDFEELGAKLDGGQVAVVVTCDANEIEDTKNKLAESGGQVQSYEVPTEALDEAAAAVSDDTASATTTP